MDTLTITESAESRIFQVAVDSPAPSYFSYLAPPDQEVLIGQMVRVPFGVRELLGYVMRKDPNPDLSNRKYKLKTISEVVVIEPLFGPDFAELVDFVAKYYMYPPGLCVKEILPGGLSPKLKINYRLSRPDPVQPGTLSEKSQRCLDLLVDSYPEEVPAASFSEYRQELLKFVKNGLAEIVYEIDGRSKGFAYEWYLSAVTDPEAKPKLGQREKELYELVRNAPPTPLSHYRQIMPNNPLVQAKNLVRKGLLVMEQRERFRDDPSRALSVPPPNITNLTEDQATAVNSISQALENNEQKGFLLFGVTGSGKTEVYLRVAEKTLASGRGVLWLAPEIALTMGLEGRLRERFPQLPYSILHSALTPGQRHDHWAALRRGTSRLAMGARSAVFAPITELGLIIVDEEHDWAYKQDDGLRYQGRDLAAWRAKASGAVLVLGSATPSLESYHRAKTGHLTLLRLLGRPGLAVLPEVKLVDLRNEKKNTGAMANQVRASLKETFERGEQALMFINRRGLASLPLCLSCGEVLKCPHCSMNLTLHSNFDKLIFENEEDSESADFITPTAAKLNPDNLLVCHSCGYRAKPPKSCSKCASPLVRYLGVGTESLIHEIEKSFGKKGLRLDTDSTRLKGGLKSILESFSNGEADFLVGTQMAAKGHDFSNLTMVGVVEADLGLNVADFRAAERTFQLLSQVSGRAGRRERPGTVFIQTRHPEHYAMTSTRDHDYETFFENEIAIRQELGYPPFARLALIRFSGPDDKQVESLADWAANRARELIGVQEDGQIELFGPAPCPMTKLKEKYRHQMMLRTVKAADRHRILKAWLPEVRKKLQRDITMIVDVDPYNLM